MFYEKSVSFYNLAKKPFLISHLFFYVQRQPRIPLLAGIGIGAKKSVFGGGCNRALALCYNLKTSFPVSLNFLYR